MECFGDYEVEVWLMIMIRMYYGCKICIRINSNLVVEHWVKLEFMVCSLFNANGDLMHHKVCLWCHFVCSLEIYEALYGYGKKDSLQEEKAMVRYTKWHWHLMDLSPSSHSLLYLVY